MTGYPQFVTGISVQYQGGASFAQFGRDMDRAANRAVGATSRLSRDAGRSLDSTSEKFRALALAAQTAQGPFSTLGTRFNAISRSLDELGSRLGGTLAALAGGGALIASTAAFQNYTALLKSTTESEQEFQSALAQTFEIAQRSRTSLEGTIRLYARIKPSLDQAGVGFQDLGTIVETANKSITLSGAGAQEATAAMIQLSQALSLGRLSGDEFRSLGENAGFLLKTIRDGIAAGNLIDGFDGSTGALRKLSEEQRLTTDIIVEALRIMEGEVNARFERMPVTISQGATQIQTSVLSLLNTFEQSTGVLAKLGQAMVALANNMDVVLALAVPLAARFLGVDRAAVALGAGIRTVAVATGALGASSFAQSRALVQLGVSADVARAGAQRLAAAQGAGSAVALGYARAQNVAASAATLLAGAGRGLLAILGGPLGAAITALTVGLTFLAFRKDAVAKAAERMGISEEELRGRISGVSDQLERQNGLLNENARLKQQREIRDAEGELFRARQIASEAIPARGSTRADPAELEAIRRGVASGSLTGDQALRRLQAAGVSETNFGGYGRIVEALTGADAARQARDAEVERALNASSRSLGPNFGGVRTAQNAAQDASAANIIRDAKLAAQAETALTEKRRLRAQADIAINAIARDTKLTEQQKREQIIAAERAYLSQAEAIDQKARAEREAAKGARAAAADARRAAREQESLENQQERLRRSSLEAAEGWAAQTEAQRIAERAGDALRVQQQALAAGAIDLATALTRSQVIQEGAQAQARQPVTDITQSLDNEQKILAEILAGREIEAELLRIKGDLARQQIELTAQEESAIRSRLGEIRAENLLLNERNQLVEIYARSAGRVQGAFRDTIRRGLDGNFNPTQLVNDLGAAFKDAVADALSVQLFGDQEAAAREAMLNAQNRNVQALEDNTAALRGQGPGGATPATPAGGIAQTAAGVGAILGGRTGGVIGMIGALIARPLERLGVRTERSAQQQTEAVQRVTQNLPANPQEAFTRIGDSLGKALGISGLGKGFAGALSGAGTGSLVAGVGNLLGANLNGTGAQIGGAVGGALGSFIPIPGGQIVGEILGSIGGGLLGNAFRSAKKGSVTIIGADGTITQTDPTGNSASRREGAVENASAFTETLRNIADRLGATLGDFRVSIGARDDVFSVDPTGQGFVSRRFGVTQFKEAQDAIEFALRDAINDGALRGIRATTARLLRAGNDFQAALDKAVRFEDVFRRLRGFTDPVGLAVDDLNREFEQLRRIFEDAGASQQEFADLQRLYDLERERTIIESQSRITQSLRSLLDDLLIGDNGLSLRDRRANAQSEFARFNSDAAIQADPDGFAQAARNLLDVERQLFGSQTPYFERFNEIIETSRRVLGTQSTTLPPAFSVGERLDTKPITDGLNAVGNSIVDAIDNLRAVVQRSSGSGGGAAVDSFGFFQARAGAF